ncbi:MAG: AzlD domain-containing protein [Dermatophilaceae bacterium]
MTLWTTVLLSCVLAYLTKLAGFIVPAAWLEGPRISRITRLLPAALLAGLIVTQTFGGASGHLAIDARLAAVGVAVVLLILRANFLVVVFGAASAAALLRYAGWS